RVSSEAMTRVSSQAMTRVSSEAMTRVSSEAMTRVSSQAMTRVSPEAMMSVSSQALPFVSLAIIDYPWGTIEGWYALGLRPFQSRLGLLAGGRSGASDRGAGRRTRARRFASGPARRHRLGQDVHDGADDRAREPADAGDGPQQDSRRAVV